MNLSENAIKSFEKLYYKKDPNEKHRFLEYHPQEVFARVANFISGGIEEEQVWYNRFFDMMCDGYFRPNTPCLMNAGIQENPQTAACFVSGMEDDLLSILDMDREAALIFSSGSGIGANFGVLREKGALLSSGGQSSGPFAFIRKLASTGEAVKSGGRSRRAAILIMFFDNHPDLLEFITLKNNSDQSSLRSMNLSVALSNKFMKAVENDDSWDLVGVVDKQVKSTHKARDIFDMIANNAHKTGDPGVWFIDRNNEDNGLIKEFGRIISTNPCGEQALLSRNCCALASINLAKFISMETKGFDFDKFEEIVKCGTYFLDLMIEKSGYPTKDYEQMAKQTRPIGLGLMGLADMLCLLEIPYDSREAYGLCDKISWALTNTAIKTSIELGKKYGSFPALKNNTDSMIQLCEKFGVSIPGSIPLRNSSWTTIAPTGTISISCDCSPGMEPLFGITYTKNLADSDEKWIFVNPIFEKKYKGESWYKEAIEKIELNHGSCQGIACVPKGVQKVWRVAHDIHWKDRIEMQAALQSNISNAISSTINLPREATVDEIKAIYTLAWEKGLKGITVYRDGSLDSQPVEFTKKPEKSIEKYKPKEFVRSRVLDGKSYCVVTGHGKIYLSINTDANGNVVEIFPNGAKGGGISSAMMEAIGRLSSLALQKGVHVESVAKALFGISDGRMVWDRLEDTDKKPSRINSVPDAIAQVLYRFYVNNAKEEDTISIVPTEEVKNLICPECGGPSVFKEGCIYCPICGSRCG